MTPAEIIRSIGELGVVTQALVLAVAAIALVGLALYVVLVALRRTKA